MWCCLLQAKSFSLVLDVLTRFKAADVQKAVEMLSSEELDVLVKYIYRGFAEPTENSCGILLTWHEKVGLCAIGCTRVEHNRRDSWVGLCVCSCAVCAVSVCRLWLWGDWAALCES